MNKKQLAKTQYKKGYWLVWKTGFNLGFDKMRLTIDPELSEELANDISVVLETEDGEYLADAICHYGSYGVKLGLWEVMMDNPPKSWDGQVEGDLTWLQVQKLFDHAIREKKEL